MKKIIFGIFTLIILSSCSEEKLTNETALNVIQQNFSKDCTQRMRLEAYPKFRSQLVEAMKEAKENGYLSNLTSKETGSMAGILYKGYLSSKADEFLVGEKNGRNTRYKIATTEITEILGIAENKENNTAVVKFSYSLKPTPLYKLREQEKSCDLSRKADFTNELTLIKFDTGWEVKKEERKRRGL